MLRREKAKTTALVLTAVILIVYAVRSAVFPVDLASVALSPGCTIYARMFYPFFHASFLHALLNCWVLLCLVFYYNIGIGNMLLAYLIAVTVPTAHYSLFTIHYSLASAPTVGLSSVVFCLLGMTSWVVKCKLYYHFYIATFISAGFVLPWLCSLCGFTVATPNNFLHIYCYVVGLLVGFLNSPAPWQRK